jgi:DNA-directed RNA polymerase subunit RPC12/RpoP
MPLVVASFRSPSEAETALAALHNAGIEAMLVPQPGEFLGVVAAEEDADRAVEVLDRLWPDVPAEKPVIEIERCRECGSTDILKIRRLPFFIIFSVVMLTAGYAAGQIDLFALLIVIIGGVLVIGPNRRCLTCGERWRDWSSAPPPPPPSEVEPPDVACPRCGSTETGPIDRRRMKALTMLINFVLPPLLFVWPFLPKRKCDSCGHEWR